MRFFRYLKEKWLTYVFIGLSFSFAYVVYRLDANFNVTPSNASYILAGLIIFFAIFVAVDFVIFALRLKRFAAYYETYASAGERDAFGYPMDIEHAKVAGRMAQEFERLKKQAITQSSEELEFITQWLHEVKMPISAMRLILDSYRDDLRNDMFHQLDAELTAFESKVQTVFYHIKSNTFQDDYKIKKASTRQLIRDALKGYSSFFSYKKIRLKITGKDCTVLTDEKWCGYILSQILSNAVKYTPAGGRIDIHTEKHGDKTAIRIKNSGKGILKKDLGQVFKKGYTSSEERSRKKATGYGLYLAKKLSVKLNHELAVDSVYGDYTQFGLVFTESKTLHHVTEM